MYTFSEVNQMLINDINNYLSYLFPRGELKRNEFCVGSLAGERGESLKIHLHGSKAGLWKDFADPDTKGGDLIALWAAKFSINQHEAYQQICDWLNVKTPSLISTKKQVYKEIKDTYAPIDINCHSDVGRYLTQARALSPETIIRFKLKENGNTLIFPYYRDDALIMEKYFDVSKFTEHGKKIMWSSKDTEPCLFGWDVIPKDTRFIILTEGEIDAMTYWQYGFPALSIPFGAGSGDKHQWIDNDFKKIMMFDAIYISMDQDEEGRKTALYLVARFGAHKCRLIELPNKDINECLQKMMLKEEIEDYITNAKHFDPEELKRATHFVDQVVEIFYPSGGKEPGYEPPWDKAKGKVLFRPSELSVWTGINGHGKSQFLGQIILGSLKQNARVCIASLELKPARLLHRLTRQTSGLVQPTEEYIRAIHEWYGDQLWLFDLVGTAKTKRLLEVFLYARRRYGIDVFVIDSFMKLDIAEDDLKAQKMFMEQLCDFKNQYNCHIHIIVHPRKSSDESQAPGKLDNKGSGAISDLADNCFSVWRNKKKEELLRKQAGGKALSTDELERIKEADCIWTCDKQRNGDWEGKIGFMFHAQSFQYLASESHNPVQYVEYSCCA